MGNAEDTDIAMLLVYNKDKETAVDDTKTALRSSQHAELQLPSDWQDDELIAYLSFCSADGNTIANSIRPVSYTHLMITELPAFTGTSSIKPSIVERINVLEKEALLFVIPVSYTHLDVYKRQIQLLFGLKLI